MQEYDVWSNDDGRLTTTVAEHAYVDDNDAPYLFSKHELRVSANSRQEALSKFRAEKNA